MEIPKTQRCRYKNNGCAREELTLQVKIHMCEGNLYFKCYEYERLNHSEPINVSNPCRRSQARRILVGLGKLCE